MQEWLESVGVGVPGYVTPKVAIGAVVGNDAGAAAARAAGRLGHLAVPDGVGRRRLLAGRGGRQGGRRGDRHRVRAVQRVLAVIDGQRMGFSRFGMYMVLFHCTAIGRRAAAAPAGVRRRRLVRPRRAAARPRPGPSGGRRWRSRRSTARTSPRSTTPSAPRSGAPDVRSPTVGETITKWSSRQELRKRPPAVAGVRSSGSWSRRKRSTSATSSPGSTPRRRAGRRPAVSSSGSVVVVELVVDQRLEPGDVLDEVLVVGDQRGHPGVVLGGGAGQRLGRRRGADQHARPLDERQRRLRRRHLGGVLRAPRPTATPRSTPAVLSASLQHADDAGRALVARALEVEAVDDLGIAGRAEDLHRPGVRHVGEQGAEADRHRRAVALGDADELAAEQPPAQRRLGTEHEEDVAAGRPTPTTARPSATRWCGDRR